MSPGRRRGAAGGARGYGGDPRFAAYLQALAERLDGRPADNARAVDEIAAHLGEVAAAEAAAGRTPDEAAAQALARIGSVEAVAARFAAVVDDSLGVGVALRVARLGMMWLLVMGLAGFLAEPMAWLVGRDFFVGNERLATVTAARCARLMALHHMTDCHAALMEDHFGELVQFGLVLAVVAALVLWALRATSRRVEPLRGRARSDAWTARAGAALFAIFACLGTTGVLSRAPDGRDFMVGVVAAVVAVGYAARMRLGAPRARAHIVAGG